MHETIIKRTIYVATCPTCEERVEKTDDPPKERFCDTCKAWVPFEAISYTGQDLEAANA